MSDFKHTSELIRNADAVAVFAGAGMGVDSGLEKYRGADGLWVKTINVNGHDISYYDLMTHESFLEVPKSAWALIGSLTEKYKQTKPHEGFYQLLEMIKDKDYFVVTSNVDEHFQKAGFDENKIFECHGSIFYMQCTNIKEREIWLTPDIDVDKKNFVAVNIPKCPDCGAICRPNMLLFADWFWANQRAAYQQVIFNKWNKRIREEYKNIVAIEIGAGLVINTVRKASESFSKENIPLIRINPSDADVKLSNQISVRMGAKDAIASIFGNFH